MAYLVPDHVFMISRKRLHEASAQAQDGAGATGNDTNKGDEAEGGRKMRRLHDEPFIDLTEEEPAQATAASASVPSSAARGAADANGKARRDAGATSAAVSNGRRQTAAVTGGGPHVPAQPLRLPAQPCIQPAPQAGRATATPPTASARIKVEAAVAATPMVHGGLKMTLLEAVGILGAEAFQRLAACAPGTEEIQSLDRLLELCQAVRN